MQPSLDEREADAARRPILSGWVTQGPEVAAFEKEFAAYVGAKYACAVSSCTTALHLALLAVGVKAGDEVIAPSHSFIATANSIRYCSAKPVFVDIEPDTFNINPALIERAITPRTRAILAVHQIGMPCDLEKILAVARARNLPVVEDAACAIGSEILWQGRWETIGKPHGDIACFSFHPRKVITTGDGGMLTTSSAEWDQQFRLWRQHGMSIPDIARHGSKEVIFESYPVVGYNYRMTDIQAAIGREQLKRLPELIARRRQLAERYHRLLSKVSGVTVPSEPSFARSNWQSYCIRLPAHCNQRAVMQKMLDLGVATRRGVMCSHRETAWSEIVGKQSLPVSEAASDHCIVLPLYPQMSEQDQDFVVAALRSAIA
jgi:dTDP-4-amino-4,6-dideoxygalactose transaminase